MQTIILAGGQGKRLRPITCTMPKPMTPLLNKPTLYYTLELLKKHGFYDVAVTLGYMGGAIKKALGTGEAFGLNVSCSHPEKTLGTAGSARFALGDDIKDTVLVTSGDGLTDFDLSAAYRAHKASGAEVTVLLYQVARPCEYGIALLDENGFISGFAEKPSLTQVFSDHANTGIYFIEPGVFRSMPVGVELDFSKDVFPKLLASGSKMFGLKMQGYWNDIGNAEELCRTQRDMLNGRCAFDTEAELKDGVYIEKGAVISPEARLAGPCYIGGGARIGAYASVEDCSVIGRGAVLEEGASVKRAVLFNNAVLRQGAEARGAVICERAELCCDSAVYEGAVIGAGSVVEAGASVCQSVLVWPGKTIESGEKCNSNISWGTGERLRANGSCFAGSGDRLITPQTAVSIAAAYASLFDLPAELLIGGDGKPSSVMLKHALASGAASQGVEARMTEPSSSQAFVSLLRHLGASGGIYVKSSESDTGVCVKLYDKRGIEAEARDIRAVENCLRSGELMPDTGAELGLISSAGGGDMCLTADVGRNVNSRILSENPSHLLLNAPYELCLDAAAYLLRYGWTVDCAYDCKKLLPAEDAKTISILCDENERVSCRFSPEITVDHYSLLAITAVKLHVKTAVVPLDFDTGLENSLKAAGIEVMTAPESAEARRRAAANAGVYVPAMHEPVITIVKACELFASGELSAAAEELPVCHRRTKELGVPRDMAACLMRRIADEERGAVACFAEGVKLRHDTGWVTVKPCADRPAFRVAAGSRYAEYSKELCDIYLDKLRSLRSDDK